MKLARMWSQFGSLAACAALAVASTGVLADPLAPAALDPGIGAAGSYSEQVCPAPLVCPSNGGSINGHTDITFSIINNAGVANVSLIGNVTLSTDGYFTFSYQVLDAGMSVISSGGPPQNPADFSVPIGSYLISMDWTFTANPGAAPTSAAWILNVTTGTVHRTPEPGTLALIGIALAGLGFLRRKQV